MNRETWTKEKLFLLKDYMNNGFSDRHMCFMLDVTEEQLKDGKSRIEESGTKGEG